MSAPWAGVGRGRLLTGAVGGLLAAFGGFRLVTEVPVGALLGLAGWLVAALVLHDAVLSPVVVGVGSVLGRVPARARRYLQGALVAGGLVTVVAVPLLLRAGSQPAAKALLGQDYRANLLLLLGLVAAVAGMAYLVQVARERRDPGRRPAPDDG